MKLMHLSDLHLGKRLGGFSMLDDQAYILEQILSAADAEQPDAVLIAGDVYDRPAPPAEAVRLFDAFLVRLSKRGLKTVVISGNHDSADRLAFGARLMDASGVVIAPPYEGTVTPVTLRDGYGEVRIWPLPFVRRAQVQRFFPEEELRAETEAIAAVIRQMAVDAGQRNVLVAHQFVSGASVCDSEEIQIGTADSVDAAVFDAFDYVALGHLHGAQSVGRETVRYCGTPLKYSVSEKDHVKSVTVVELGGKGDVTVRTLPLTPKHDLRELRGAYDALTLRESYENTAADDYLSIVLTDEQDVPDALAKLRVIYPNILQLRYDNTRTRAGGELLPVDPADRRTELELFEDFYALQNGQTMTPEQRALSERLLREIKEGEA